MKISATLRIFYAAAILLALALTAYGGVSQMGH